MIKIVPFKKEHIDCMEVREHEKYLIDSEILEMFESGMAYTGIYDGRIISCGGLLLKPYGNADIWQIPSIYIKDVRLSYCKIITKWIKEQAHDLALNRMETISLDDGLHNRWMRFLGFEKEGVKRRLINGKDYAMWGRVFEVNNGN
jgi:hypothetical protein